MLDVYARPYDERYPQVCFDETSKQLLADVQEPLPMAPERPQREDYEYERRGVRNLFLQTRIVARHGRNRTGHPEQPVLGPAHSR